MADTRSIQRKINRVSQIETFAKGDLSRETIERIQVQITLLNQEWDDYKIAENNYKDTADVIALQDIFEAKYFDIKRKLMQAELALKKKEQHEDPDSSFQQLVDSQRSFLNEISNLNNKGDSEVRLPRVNVPFFSGTYSEFTSFHDLFEASINSNNRISKVHKFQYLKGLLRGEAAALVRHISITEANYDEAWEIIKNRYDKKKHVTKMLLKQFMDQPSITQASAKALHHMRDVSDEVLRGLKVLGEQAESRDPWLIHILVNKLDQTTKHDWAQHSFGIEFPTIVQFFDFLYKQSDTLESCETTKRIASRPAPSPDLKLMHAETKSISCLKCGQNHYLRSCEDFLRMSINDRRNFVAENKLCFICLFKSHLAPNCRSKFRCGLCRARHHTILHLEVPKVPENTNILCTETVSTLSKISEANSEYLNVAHAHATATQRFTALLPTAIIKVLDSSNKYQRCRVLLDSGAQASFISESCAQRLALPRKNAKILIKGLTPGTETTRGLMTIRAGSLYSNAETVTLDVLILPKLTNPLPSCEINISNFKKIQGLQLADPFFSKPGTVDIIIGADRFFHVLREGRLEDLTNNLSAQNSIFGWIIAGAANTTGNHPTSLPCHMSINIDETIRRFWEMEELPSCSLLSKEESECEEHFKNNFEVHNSGRYIVKLPIKKSIKTLGNSLNIAKKRFFNLENKLNRDFKLKSEYVEIMREYITLGHLCEIRGDVITTAVDDSYYLPHHVVTKEESLTTMLRVVFDGSSKTTNGTSINDLLMVGPTLQPTLWTTLLKFRYNKIALTADIEKMYRQVMVAKEDQKYQQILWREKESEPLIAYKLTTVTFGMASSAFLATRCLQQTAFDFQHEYPLIANEILFNFYIDDYLSGADTIEEALYLKEKLGYVLKQRGFNFRKWKSNTSELRDLRGSGKSLVPIEDANSYTKILGLQWNSEDDLLSFKVNLPEEMKLTKRSLISNASKVFDPLGLIAPSTIIAKILYQQLWLRKLEWDEELPNDIAILWRQLKVELPQLEQLKIPRHIRKNEMQIHGFCDASERAYAAVIYIRFKNEKGDIQAELIASKTKVAPIKQVSLPRLELCGAHLLSKLILEVKKTLPEGVPVHGWTDSNIVLSWLSGHPTKWKTFVANRVSEIQQLLPRNHWSHVKSQNNPADYASRGVLPSKLIILDQWWHGPLWLTQPEQSWPIAKNEVYYADTTCEMKQKQSISLIHTQTKLIHDESEIYDKILNKTFSFNKVLRIVSFIYRFINNSRKTKETRQFNGITLNELSSATKKLIKWIQYKEYSSEIAIIAKHQTVSKNNPLSSLTPFLDADGLLRVGGRLNNSTNSYESKHPIILPNNHIVSKMIITYFHLKYLHPGPSHTFHLIRQTYWIVKGRAVVRHVVQKCIQCYKNRAKTAKQLMGDLPSVRVVPAKPFANCGIDYAGPIVLASKRGRGAKMVKGYIAIFVCMITKAIHIEAVTELTTDAFIAALKRFSSRRNVPSNIYSDNGTNFIGANRKLKEVYKFNHSQINDSVITEFCALNDINWHHIPPSAPHFGGLWESAVKSVKTHLNRVTGNCHLTYEEMSTLLCQIEGILNSRPLCAMSEEDDSFEALTPAHFLMGSSVAAVPENDLGDLATSRLSRWQQVEHRAQSFLKRFHKDYLNNLQQRNKWKTREENLKIGDLVLIKEDNLPSCKWAMGRIIEIHPDEQGLIRVVTIKTSANIFKRPITKVCPLPID